MTTETDRRAVLEQLLSSRECSQLVERVRGVYNDHTESLAAFWEYALTLPEQWASMSKLPTRPLEDAVANLLSTAHTLSTQLEDSLAEVRTLKGYTAAELCMLLRKDVNDFIAFLERTNGTTEAVLVRPRSMGKVTAERTFYCRAMTRFLLEDGLPPNASLVSMVVPILLGEFDSGEFGEKEVRDLTVDICRELHRGT